MYSIIFTREIPGMITNIHFKGWKEQADFFIDYATSLGFNNSAQSLDFFLEERWIKDKNEFNKVISILESHHNVILAYPLDKITIIKKEDYHEYLKIQYKWDGMSMRFFG